MVAKGVLVTAERLSLPLSKTGERGDTLSEGQSALVHSDKHMRGFWKLGKVQKLIQGSDAWLCERSYQQRAIKLHYLDDPYNVYIPWK